jgi:hypothetical protein
LLTEVNFPSEVIKQLLAYRFRAANENPILANLSANDTPCRFAFRQIPTALHLVSGNIILYYTKKCNRLFEKKVIDTDTGLQFDKNCLSYRKKNSTARKSEKAVLIKNAVTVCGGT